MGIENDLPCLFIDTPGFLDTDGNERANVNQMITFLRNIAGGINAFLIVLNIMNIRLDQGIKETLRKLEYILGVGFWRHVIIVYTHCDIGYEQLWQERYERGSAEVAQEIFNTVSEHAIDLSVVKTSKFGEVRNFSDFKNLIQSKNTRYSCDSLRGLNDYMKQNPEANNDKIWEYLMEQQKVLSQQILELNKAIMAIANRPIVVQHSGGGGRGRGGCNIL